MYKIICACDRLKIINLTSQYMADSPNSSASQSNIDDLVKELSRPQGSPPPQAVTPVPSVLNTLPRPTPVSPVPAMPPRPATAPPVIPPRANPVPVPSGSPVAPSAPKEYQSSIRTMSDDLSKLKAGQQPQGVNIPRKIDNTPVPAKPTVPVAPAPAPPKPMSTSSLPSATKSAPIPFMPGSAPKSPPTNPIPRPVMPTMPPVTKVPETKLDQKNQFYVPPAATKATGSGSRGLIFAVIAVIVVLLGGLYWYFMIRSSSTDQPLESPITTFTPRPTATPNPDVLSTVFTNHGGTIVLPSTGDPSSAFSNAISAQPNITPGTLTVIDIIGGASNSAQVLTISGFLNRFLVSYPPALATALGQNYKFLLYGQKESFDSKGRPVTNVAPGPRLVMVSEIASSSEGIFQGWEPTMSTNLSAVMAITPAKNMGPFLITNYNGASVHFKNFPYPDHSIDYGVVSFQGKNYLIIAGSREAMFATIDTLLVVPGK